MRAPSVVRNSLVQFSLIAVFGDTVVKVLDWVRREEDWKIVAERQEG